MLLGLIYCTPRNAGQITFWEKDSGRPVCLCVLARDCVCVCVCLDYMRLSTEMNTDEIISRVTVSMPGEIKVFKKEKR